MPYFFKVYGLRGSCMICSISAFQDFLDVLEDYSNLVHKLLGSRDFPGYSRVYVLGFRAAIASTNLT